MGPVLGLMSYSLAHQSLSLVSLLLSSNTQQESRVEIHAHAVTEYNSYSLYALEFKNIFLYLILPICPAPMTSPCIAG